jgi:hypothetical protein
MAGQLAQAALELVPRDGTVTEARHDEPHTGA